MNAKVYGIGIIAGILLAAVLQYPLQTYLPGAVVKELPQGQVSLAWALTAAGLLLILAAGAVAARMSGAADRKGAALAGTVAGLMSALIAEIAVGGAAAGVWGSREILAFGLNPTQDDLQFTKMLADAVISTLLWTYASIWIALLAGAGLGALGGFVAGNGGAPAKENPELIPTLSAVGILTSALALVVAFAIFPILANSVQKTFAEMGQAASLSSEALSAVPIVTTYLLLIFWQIIGWLAARRELSADMSAPQAITPASTIAMGAIPLLAAAVLLLIDYNVFAWWLVLCALLSLTFGALTLRIGFALRQKSKQLRLSPFDARASALIGVLTAFLMIATAYISATASSLNVVMLDVTMIAVLSTHDAASAAVEAARVVGGVPGLVSANFATHRGILYAGVALCALLIPFVIFFDWAARHIAARRISS
ncbi:MAG: hypothetical protein IT314_01335 [Anaerolineales bacterium]|nr:hypothetical protein [Anaerolineales bacterium]